MESHEQIRNRMLRAAARQWGYQESDMDLEAFDPLVRLLIEACAGETARLERTLENSETRILERMLEQLSPEVLTGPLPAHAVATMRALSGREAVDGRLQCTATAARKGGADVYFSPLAEFSVFNATIACLELGGEQLLSVGTDLQRTRIARGTRPQPRLASTVWIGLDLDRLVTDLTGLRFYFNWLNAPRLAENLEWLRHARWSCGGHPLRVTTGLPANQGAGEGEVSSFLSREYSRHQRAAKRILDHYAPHFVSLRGFAQPERAGVLTDHLHRYPPEFEELYALEDLAVLEQKLLWLRVDFPTQLVREDLQQTTCLVNALPVANLRRHRAEGKLRDQVNIIPLETESYYFDLLRAVNREGVVYDEIPLTNIRGYEAGQYSIRRRDAGKFGKREANRALLNLLDVLRDESAAFSAYGQDVLRGKITGLNQHLKELEQLLSEHHGSAAGLAFLVVRPLARDRHLDVDYLSTQGEDGNGLIAGQELDLARFAGIDRRSLRLVTTSRGGRAPLSRRDRKYAYKKAIISRGRIVSREDIRAFCGAAFGEHLSGDVTIRKGYANDANSRRGVRRVLEVILTLTRGMAGDDLALPARVAGLERELNYHSAGVLPIRVRHQFEPEITTLA